MWRGLITVLVALVGLVQQIMRNRERAQERMKGEKDEEHLRKIEADPAEWFAQHFGAGTTIVVQPSPCEPRADSVREDDRLSSDGAAAEAEPDGAGDR